MRKLTDIYQEYKITPNLQRHQLRVAAVARQICDSLDISVDANSVIQACLLHDMANVIKFKIRQHPELIESETFEYWEAVQKEFIEKYGTDEHDATLEIARELGISDTVLAVMDAIGFHNWCLTSQSDSWEQKIATYADTRVSPYGVASLNDRLEDANRRYPSDDIERNKERDALYDCSRAIEKQIFAHSSIKPEEITTESVQPIVDELKKFAFEI